MARTDTLHRHAGGRKPLSGLEQHQHPGGNVRAIAEIERAGRQERRGIERVAGQVAARCGTAGFLWSQILLFGGWVGWNSWPGLRHFDPYPYILLTLLLSIEAIFLSIFVLISQQEEARLSDRRNALDLQINLLAEQESTEALRMLRQIGRKLGVEFEDGADIEALEKSTHPTSLAKQIDQITRREDGQANPPPRAS